MSVTINLGDGPGPRLQQLRKVIEVTTRDAQGVEATYLLDRIDACRVRKTAAGIIATIEGNELLVVAPAWEDLVHQVNTLVDCITITR